MGNFLNFLMVGCYGAGLFLQIQPLRLAGEAIAWVCVVGSVILVLTVKKLAFVYWQQKKLIPMPKGDLFDVADAVMLFLLAYSGDVLLLAGYGAHLVLGWLWLKEAKSYNEAIKGLLKQEGVEVT